MAKTASLRMDALNPIREVIDRSVQAVSSVKDGVAATRDRISDVVTERVTSVVDTGENLRDETSRTIRRFLKASKRRLDKRTRSISKTASRGLESLLHSVNLASTGDLARIHDQLEDIKKKLDRIERSRKVSTRGGK